MTPASPACPAARDQTLSPLARTGALGGLLFADSVRYACQGLWRPWTLPRPAVVGIFFAQFPALIVVCESPQRGRRKASPALQRREDGGGDQSPQRGRRFAEGEMSFNQNFAPNFDAQFCIQVKQTLGKNVILRRPRWGLLNTHRLVSRR